MPDRLRKIQISRPKKKKHNYLRDILVILAGIGLVFLFFQNQSRFNYNSSGSLSKSGSVSHKIEFPGEYTPASLKLKPGEFKSLYALLAAEDKNFKHIAIYIEKQDSYATLKDTTELRYWCILTTNTDKTIKTVINRTTRKQLEKSLVRRLRQDIKRYKETMGKTSGGTFQNTM